MTKNDNSFSQSGQRLALTWMKRYLRAPAKAADIRDSGRLGNEPPEAERRALRLHSSCLRNLRLYQEIFSSLVTKKPATEIEAALLLALTEADLDTTGRTPAIIDSWVRAVRKMGSPKTAGFANAVLRRAVERLSDARTGALPLSPAILYSHPDWLVERWTRSFGLAETERLLRWNQSPSLVYASGQLPESSPGELDATRWPLFSRLMRGLTPEIREALATGKLTIRDPATRIAEDLLCATSPGTVLDLCASPGGKSRALLSRPDGPHTLVAADREERLSSLQENLAPWHDRTTLRAIDLDHPETLPDDWRENFDGVLLDAPCSNTGVIHRKPDVKWRLTPKDMKAMPKIQIRFLRAASQFVRPGGTLVYSTCSIENEENRAVAEKFLRSPEGQVFQLTAAIRALPTRTGHDGAGIYRFLRSKDR
ncbi:MAG: RsmB/NOP family class I SAM-dependent RNA methyltransferase [Puniceicoccales bacterium]